MTTAINHDQVRAFAEGIADRIIRRFFRRTPRPKREAFQRILATMTQAEIHALLDVLGKGK